jgi:hypothetical protein
MEKDPGRLVTKKCAGPVRNIGDHKGGVIIRINSFVPLSTGPAGGFPARTARKKFRICSGGSA